MTKKTHNDVMASLMKSQSVKDYMDQAQVKLGLKILKKRLDLKLTQTQLVAKAHSKNIKITQAQLSRIENGDPTLGIEIYNKAILALDGHLKVGVEFDDETTNKDLVMQ